MERTVLVTESTGRILAQLASSGTPRITRKPSVRVPREPTFPGVTFKNVSGETMPAFACMKVVGVEWDDDLHRLIVLGDKTDTTFGRHFLANGPHEVENEKRGRAQEGMVRVLYDTGTTPVQGNGYGPVPGQWYVGQHYPETLLVGGEHDDGETLLGEWHDISKWMGEAAEEIADEGSGDVTVMKGVSGSMTDAGFTDVAVHSAFGMIEIASAVWVETASGNNWEATQARCPA